MKKFESSKLINPLTPKGFLVLIGGNEDKEKNSKIFSTILSLIKKKNKNIEIVTTASQFPEQLGQEYYRVFKKDKDNNVGIINISKREQAYDLNLLERISNADIIFFTGGDQLRITSILGGTPIEKEILRKYFQEICVISGSSAGASVMSKTIITGGDSKEALQKGKVRVSTGIGLIEDVIIDTHFIERGRFSRLMQIISMNPGNIGVGIGENSGIIIQSGYILKAIGKGITVILDGQNLKYTNVADIYTDESIAIENLVIHTIVNGFGYDLCNKKYLNPEELIKLYSVESEEKE